MAIERAIMLLKNQGIDSCCCLELTYEPGRDLDDARVLGICPNPPSGAVRKLNSGICQVHIQQLDREGGFILE
jgi:hypothetical protein